MSNSGLNPEKKQLTQALVALNKIGQTLVVIQDLPETLKQIVFSAKDVLGADIVDLYEYVQARNEFILPPIQAGERQDKFVPKEKIYEDDVVVKVIKMGAPQYYPDVGNTTLLIEKFIERPDAPKQRFITRESVKSSASLPLKAGAETVGVMFVNYRTTQDFNEEQRNLIESFAQLAAIAIYNARLFESEHKRRQLYETLQETARCVNESLSLKDVSDRALEQLSKVMEYSTASIQLFEGKHRKVLSEQTHQPLQETPRLLRDITDDRLVSKILENYTPYVLSNVNDEPLWEVLPATEHIKSWIGVPLITKGQIIGLLTVDHEIPGYYTQENGDIVAAFADQLAVAIYNSIQAQALARLNQLSYRLVSLSEGHDDFRKLLEEIAENAKEVLRADIVELYEYYQTEKTYQLPQISVGERHGSFVPKEKIYEDDVVMELIHRPGPSYVEDAQADIITTGDYTIERTDKPKDRFAVREEIQATAAIPLKSGSESVGLMFANYRTPQRFTGEQKELIELFAKQAAIAIQNARLYRELDSKVRERTQQLEDVNDRLEVLVSFGQTLTSGLHLKEGEILNLIHRQASELMDTQNMYIALYDQKTDTITFGLAFEKGKPISVAPRKIDDTQRGRTEEIIRTKKPIFLPTREESEEWYQQPSRQKFVSPALPSWIGVPMISENRVLGVIATYHPTEDNVYSEDDLKILQGIAGQAAIALDNARRYSELEDANTKIAEKEAVLVRSMIAADFVHRLNNLAGTIPAWVDLIRENLEITPLPLDEVSDYLNKIWRDADDLLRAAEQLKDMPQKRQVDVAFALQSMLRPIRIQYRNRITVSEIIQPELHKVYAVPFALVGALSNIVTNGVDALMEAGGGTLSVHAYNQQNIGIEGIKIEVKDTGKGISTDFKDKLFMPFLSTKGEGRGYGLWRAKTVIEELGGSIQVESELGKGTTFIFWLPKSVQEESNVTE